jgi:hypothetical protein
VLKVSYKEVSDIRTFLDNLFEEKIK